MTKYLGSDDLIVWTEAVRLAELRLANQIQFQWKLIEARWSLGIGLGLGMLNKPYGALNLHTNLSKWRMIKFVSFELNSFSIQTQYSETSKRPQFLLRIIISR